MKPKIVVVGSSNTDMILRLRSLPRPGETVLGGAFAVAAGGKGANQAVGAARAGGDVLLVARIGRDGFGDRAAAGWAADRIRAGGVVRDPDRPSGTALIFVAADGENCIGVAAGANAALSPADVRRAEPAIAAAGAILLSLEVPLNTVMAAALIAVRRGTPVFLNPAPARPLPAGLLKMVSVLTPNEGEAELLTGVRIDGDEAASRAAGRLLRRGVRRAVVITLGRRGAFVAGDGLRRRIAGFRVRAVDSTAAGDIFNGALAVALAEGRPLESAVRFAHAAAAISVTRPGAQPSAPCREEIERLVAGR
ncbi:MAG: ribokinase [Acidobacteriota bacterium]|nr:ribokinase [Acidobacteriota bacterium]